VYRVFFWTATGILIIGTILDPIPGDEVLVVTAVTAAAAAAPQAQGQEPIVVQGQCQAMVEP
jgi:hypothetical protein